MSVLYRKLQARLSQLAAAHDFYGEQVEVKALTPNEAIGSPEQQDYVILKGKEKLMQANFKGHCGQAFSAMLGHFMGTIKEIIELPLVNDYQRAVFIATLNAVMHYLGAAGPTIHCRDQEPEKCALMLPPYIKQHYGNPKIALIGYQPRMAEALEHNYQLRITDLDEDNIGQKVGKTTICSARNTEDNLKWCNLALITGSTIINGSIEQLWQLKKPTIFFGTSITGAAKILHLNHFCPLSS